MTTIHPDAQPGVAPAGADRTHTGRGAHAALRDLVRLDAAVGLASGLLLLLAAEPLSDLVGLATTGPARAVGAFLVLLGVDLFWLAAVSDRARLRWVPISAAGDVAWAVASLAVAVLADLTGPGRALVAAQGLLVLGMAEAKVVLHRRARVAP